MRSLTFLAALSLAACTGSGTTADTVADPTLVTTEPIEMEATTSDTAASSPSGVLGEVPTDASMLDLLATIPLAAAGGDSGQGTQVLLLDVEAASELAGLTRPDSDDLDASIQWVVDLTAEGSIDDGDTGLQLPLPLFPEPANIVRFSDEVDEELGFTFFEIDRSASLITVTPEGFPTGFATAEGDITLSSDLVDLGDGIVTAGSADDFEMSDSRTPARPLGRPLRLASANGRIALSTSTPLVAEWLANGPTMAESPDAAAGAGALDDVGVVSAKLFLPSSSFPAVPDIDLVRSAPFSTLALGITVIEGRAANVIAYVFADEVAATAVRPELEEEWRSGDDRATFGEPISTFFDVQSVEQRGRVVVVTAQVTDTGNTATAEQFLIRGDPLFYNN